MNFELDKNGLLQFRGYNPTFVLNHEVMKPEEVKSGLVVYVRNDLTWGIYIEEKVNKAKRLTHYVKQNTSPMTLAHPKFCLYKCLILLSVSYTSRVFNTIVSIGKL